MVSADPFTFDCQRKLVRGPSVLWRQLGLVLTLAKSGKAIGSTLPDYIKVGPGAMDSRAK